MRKIHLELTEKLANRLIQRAEQTDKTTTAIIREALVESLDTPRAHEWPEVVRNFKGVRGFPRFEDLR